MNTRQQKILTKIIEEYIKSAEPISSGFLVRECKFDCSSATVRNEMADLESEGYVYQPHIAAGRVPTEKAYQFYLENLKSTGGKKFIDKELKKLVKIASQVRSISGSIEIKNIAKKISEMTGETAIVAFAENDIYYTGISNLFNQPEFSEYELIKKMSGVIDELDTKIGELFEEKNEITNVLVGRQNPLGSSCSFIYSFFNDGKSVFGLLGPMRMDYVKNIALVEYVNKSIK